MICNYKIKTYAGVPSVPIGMDVSLCKNGIDIINDFALLTPLQVGPFQYAFHLAIQKGDNTVIITKPKLNNMYVTAKVIK